MAAVAHSRRNARCPRRSGAALAGTERQADGPASSPRSGYISGVALGAVGAVVLALQTPLGWMFGAGLLGLACAWVITTGMAFASIRRSLIDQHKEWMIRSYVVTFAFVTFRVGDVTMQAAGIGEPLQNSAFLSWASWAVPLLVAEAILQGRKIFAVAA